MDFENNILKINDKKTLKITKYECSNKYLLLLIFGTLLNFCTMITSLLIYSKNNQRFIKQYTISEDTFKIINDNYSTKFNENLFEILNLLKYKSYNNTNYFNISEKLNLLKCHNLITIYMAFFCIKEFFCSFKFSP